MAKFRQAINCCKRVLELAKFVYTNKTKDSYHVQKLFTLLYIGPELMSSASNKAKFFAEIFSEDSNLNDSDIESELI